METRSTALSVVGRRRTEARSGAGRRQGGVFSNGDARKCHESRVAFAKQPRPGQRPGGLQPPHLAPPAPLIWVQKKARERAVLVIIASVSLPAIQLHIHFVP